MDLGLGFDDEDLQVPHRPSKKNCEGLCYTVKIYQPEWFELALAKINEENQQSTFKLETDQVPHVYKMSGDIHYFKRNYKKASEQYLTALALLPENNVCVRQDLIESLSRSYMYLGKMDESYALAKNLVEEMSTLDEARQRQSLILLSFICSSSRKWAECVDCLEKLCYLQPYYAHNWSQLGHSYEQLYNTESNFCDENVTLQCQIKTLTCYIRAKLLHQSVLGTASSFIRNRNLGLIQQIQQKIDSNSLSQIYKNIAMESMQGEIENQSNEVSDSSNNSVSSESQNISSLHTNPKTTQQDLFFQKYFSWHPEFNMSKKSMSSIEDEK
ncbi:uncharacterized protein C8orf76-like isoform X1 [Biomphalaria glabrata]|uniref:Uncharacterized protein C8orf76-like isoform X1 n=1 Tax=Biomphalaria glabrata TaxID=6526 RepID=A0A9W3AE66_BIOGL|nr:uncharacterized protein C8orf76-like isoform X1 [Biomphalaria glabrata]XP_055885429.1 uncharacterized protein C8orf76-like isoform X1 [Biomphalaria glabrata]